MTNTNDWQARNVTVCDRCRSASCWQGTFMCWESKNAGTVTVTAGDLMKDPSDHPDYWGLPEAEKEAAGKVYSERWGKRYSTPIAQSV